MILTEYLNKAVDYLKSKLPDVPEHTIMEIAAYLTNVTAVAIYDAVYKARKEFVNEIKRSERGRYPATSAKPAEVVQKCRTCEHRYWHDPECNACNEGNGFKYYTAMKDGGAKMDGGVEDV